jgi:anti-sigma-K factor RskA
VKTSEYIESGILELYAIQALTPAEMQEVEAMCAAHPEVRNELEAICVSLELLAEVGKLNPPPAIKTLVANQLTFATQGPVHTNTGNESRVVAMKPSMVPWYAVAASTVLFIASSGTAYHYYTRSQNSEQQLLALQTQNAVLAEQYQDVQKASFEITEAMAVMEKADMRVKLMPAKPEVTMSAVVFWDKANNKTYIDPSSLAELDGNRQYQLWALVDGKPVDLGVIAIDFRERPMHEMRGIEGAQAFAITIEPMGGRQSPTMENLVVLGKV